MVSGAHALPRLWTLLGPLPNKPVTQRQYMVRDTCCPTSHDCEFEGKQGSGPKGDKVLLNTGGLLFVSLFASLSVITPNQAS